VTGPAWAVTDLRKVYPGPHVALDGASFAVDEGERVALIGASGSGKSTAVRCGLGLVRPDSGQITVLGRDATRLSAREWRALRAEVQVLFQDPRAMLHPDLPIDLLVQESVALHRPGEDPVRGAQALLEQVDLAHRARALSRELSGGERRRAGIARVLAARPRLLVADEPTAGLDAVLKPRIIGRLIDAVGDRCAVVIVTHDVAAVAPFCDRFVVAEGGRVVDAFAMTDLRAGWRPTVPCTISLLAAAGLAGPPQPGIPLQGRSGPGREAKEMRDGTAEGGG
jgi:peptide/nickel transport system ATP-binding protein